MKVVHIPVAGSPVPAEIDDGDTLHGFQRLVDGYIEIVRCRYLPDDWRMVVDEEGKINGKPINSLGTALYGAPYDVIVGDVVLCKTGLVDGEPDIVGCSDDEIRDCIERFIPKVLYYLA